MIPIFVSLLSIVSVLAVTAHHQKPHCTTTLSAPYVCQIADSTLHCEAGQSIQIRTTLCTVR